MRGGVAEFDSATPPSTPGSAASQPRVPVGPSTDSTRSDETVPLPTPRVSFLMNPALCDRRPWLSLRSSRSGLGGLARVLLAPEKTELWRGLGRSRRPRISRPALARARDCSRGKAFARRRRPPDRNVAFALVSSANCL